MKLRRANTLTSLFVGLLAFLAGCESSQSTAKQESRQRWNDARAEVKLKLAADQLNAGHVGDAAAEIAEAARLDPEHPALRALQARLALAQGDLPAAERLLRDAPPEGRSRGQCEYLLGVVAEQRMRWPAALEHYLNAAEAEPSEFTYVTAIVQLLLQQGKAGDAFSWLRSHENQFGWTVAYQAALAECCEQLEDWPRAVSAWRRVADADANADIRERLALSLYHTGEWGEAASLLRQMLEKSDPPARTSLRLTLADCCLRMNDAAGAHEQLGFVLRENPRDASALRLLACAYARQGLFTRALQTAEQALQVAPDDLDTLEIAAAMAYRAGRLDRAAAIARRIEAQTSSTENPVAACILKAIDSPASQ